MLRIPTISSELRNSHLASGKLVDLSVERLRRSLDDAVNAFVDAATEETLARLNLAREALRMAGGLT